MFTNECLKRWANTILLIIAVNIGVLAAFMLSPHEEHSTMVLAAILAAFTIISVAALGFLFYINKENEKERGILREVFEGSRAARFVTDIDNRIIYRNQKLDRLLGITEDQLELHLSAIKALFAQEEETQDKYILFAENAARGETGSIVLNALFHGKACWAMVTAQPVAGWPGFIHWRIDDITDEYDIENRIKKEREKLLSFTDNAPVGFYSLDKEGYFIFANPALADWLGTTVKKLQDGMKMHECMASPPKYSAPYDILDGGGANQYLETELISQRSGMKFLTSMQQSVIFDEEGAAVRTNGIVHDLTPSRKMEQALKASEHRFRRFFEEAPLSILLVDNKGLIIDYNASCAAALGVDTEALQQTEFSDLIVSENKTVAINALKSIKEGNRLEAPIDVALKAREKIATMQMFARRFTGSEYIVLHLIDITEKKSLEAQFAQSQKMQAVGQLAGGVAHDFNNLLTAIIGFCDLLLLRHKPGDPSFSDISQIKQNSNRAANLVRQLLAFSRQQTLRPQVLDMTEVMTELTHLLRRLLGASIELDVTHEGDLGLVKVDQGQLEQVLINLAVNARDAMMEHSGSGTLEIKTFNYNNPAPVERGGDVMQPGAWVAVSVIDNGMGISEENLERIFEPFFTTKKVGQGTGLGLATVYGIVRQTGGYIDVKSKVGEGTTFTLYLPEYVEEETEDAPKEQKKPANKDLTGTATILLIDDEDAVRTFSARALANKGYNVLDVDGGEAALELYDEKKPKLDLMVTDVLMPGMDGPATAHAMLERLPDLKIIFISGYTEDRIKDEFGDNVHFLPKPFTLQQLAETVKDVLDE